MKIALNDIQRKYPDVKIEMTQNYATLSDTEKQYFDGRNYGKGMNGYYNDQTDTVVIFADNIQNTDHLEKTFAHETAGHKGLQVLLGNEYTSIIDEIYTAAIIGRRDLESDPAELPVNSLLFHNESERCRVDQTGNF